MKDANILYNVITFFGNTLDPICRQRINETHCEHLSREI